MINMPLHDMRIQSIILLLFILISFETTEGATHDLNSGPIEETVSWEPIVEMDGNIFSSYLYSTATMESWNGQSRMMELRLPTYIAERESRSERRGFWSRVADAVVDVAEGIEQSRTGLPQNTVYIGDQLGIIGASITPKRDSVKVRLEVEAGRFVMASSIEKLLPRSDVTYELFPRLEINYDELLSLSQGSPVTVVFRLYVDDGGPERKTLTARFRGINDSPFAFVHRHGYVHPTPWMFASYVNEDHPWVDALLREAINTRIVDGFYGYQRGPEGVWQQVYAIWNVMQRRGMTYSSITRTAHESEKVGSQHVRLLSDAINTSQANCVDGTVVLASILRKIDIDPFLVLVPGHMYLGFYLDRDRTQIAALETTMMGHVSLTHEAQGLLGSLASLFGAGNDASERSFASAVAAGSQQYNAALPGFQSDDWRYQIIDIAEARRAGIMPIAR